MVKKKKVFCITLMVNVLRVDSEMTKNSMAYRLMKNSYI